MSDAPAAPGPDPRGARQAALAGLAGTAVLLATALVAALAYTGRRGEAYSPFNHFVSELGERGVSPLAVVFNAGLMAAGPPLLLFCVRFGALFGRSVTAWLATAAGCVAAIACSFVGVFPMDDLPRHLVAAMTFFRAGLLTMLLFTLAILRGRQGAPVVPRRLALAGAFAFACYAAFLLAGPERVENLASVLGPSAIGARPAFWLLPALEWLVYASTILWFLLTAGSLYRRRPAPG